MTNNLSDSQTEIRKFVLENIYSIGHLEVLIFLYKSRGKKWTPEAIGAELRSSVTAVNRQLKDLCARQLLVSDGGAFGFLEASEVSNLCEQMERLVQYYDTHRVALVTLIYDRPDHAIRSFANAFKLKMED